MALPTIIPGPDMAAAIVIEAGAVLLMKVLGHQSYYVLPSAWVEPGETPEAACMRGALSAMRYAASEFARQRQLKYPVDQMSITLQRKVGEHPWDGGRTYHYFLVTGNKTSILAGPASQPVIDPYELIWVPFEWVPLEDLALKNLHPKEAISICRAVALTETLPPD